MSRNKFNSLRKFERLEDRRMMAGIDFDDGVVAVEGSGDSDQILIQTNPANANEVLITVRSISDGDLLEQEAFARNQVIKVEVEAGDGNDFVINNTNIESEMDGEDGNDTLIGGSARDVIFGGEDNDTLEGRGGNDDLTGDTGSDRYRFIGSLLGVDAVFEAASADVDTLDFTGFTAGGVNVDLSVTTARVINTGDLTLQLSSSTGIENVVGTAFDDTIRGNSRNNELRGEGLNDRIFGGDGADILLGGAGNDNMFGEAGLDRLEGGADRDYLDGGLDGLADVLIGGSGNDTFVLRRRRGSDPGPAEQTLSDFNSAVDSLQIGYY